MTEFCSKITSMRDKTRYEITFSTNDIRYFDRVEEACRACIDKTATNEAPKDIDDKTFDIVDAFMHLIWGRKVRMTHWDKGEYIEISEHNPSLGSKYLHEKEIINQDGGTYPAEYLFDKNHLDARWEDYKEE